MLPQPKEASKKDCADNPTDGCREEELTVHQLEGWRMARQAARKREELQPAGSCQHVRREPLPPESVEEKRAAAGPAWERAVGRGERAAVGPA